MRTGEPDVDVGFTSALEDFLGSRFEVEELRVLAGELPLGKAIVLRLKGDSLYDLSRDFASLVVEFDQVDALKADLLPRRPQDDELIRNIWELPMPTSSRREVTVGPPDIPPPPLPPLPVHFVERPEHGFISQALLDGQRLVGVTGLHGSGKTTAARASLTDPVRARFGQVCWLQTDEVAPMTPDGVRREIAAQLGHRRKETSPSELARTISATVGTAGVLIVLDEPRGRIDHLVDAARCDDTCHVVVTTSQEASLLSVGFPSAIRLGGLSAGAGKELHARWAGIDVDSLPDAALELAAAIGYHPLGLRILGVVVAASGDKDAEWAHLLGRLRGAALSEELELPGIADENLSSVIDGLVDELPAESQAVVQALAVVPSGAAANLDLVAHAANQEASRSRRAADVLVNRGLAVNQDVRYALFPLVHLLSRERVGFLPDCRTALERVAPDMPPISAAIGNGDARLATRLLADEAAADLAVSTAELSSPFHQAVYAGMTDLFEAMIRSGVDARTVDAQGWDALHCAAQFGHEDIARRLIDLGLSALRENDSGKDAVQVAMLNGHILLAGTLLDSEEVDEARLARYLQHAVKLGVRDLVQQLLHRGASVDPDLGDQTPLLGLAIAERHASIVDMLFERGEGDFRQATLDDALAFASQVGDLASVERLISLGADVSWEAPVGKTALVLASEADQAEIVRTLLEAGADPSRSMPDGFSAVHYAAARHRPAVLSSMAESGAAIDRAGPRNMRPLAVAVEQAKPGLTQQNGFTMTEAGVRGYSTTVISDIDPSVVETARVLLAAGAEVGARRDDGSTALHLAAHGAQPALVSLLVEFGADPETRNSAGATPRSLATDAAAGQLGLFSELRLQAIQKILN